MTDIDLSKDLWPDVPLASAAELTRVRDRLTAEIRGDYELPGRPHVMARPGRALTPGGRHGRRVRTATAITAAAAAAVAVAAAIVVMTSSDGAAPARPDPVAGQQVTTATARFLARAAAGITHEAVMRPSPDQFVYSKVEYTTGSGASGTRETWLSADGARSGYVKGPGAPGSISPCTLAQARGRLGCFPVAGFITGMPASPSGLLPYLNSVKITNTDGRVVEHWGTEWRANDIGKAVDELMPYTDLLPAEQAALYRLIASTPGFTIIPHIADAAGRVGVGVKWTFEGAVTAIILDPETYAYLGDAVWTLRAPNAVDRSALVKMAIVDRARQLP